MMIASNLKAENYQASSLLFSQNCILLCSLRVDRSWDWIKCWICWFWNAEPLLSSELWMLRLLNIQLSKPLDWNTRLNIQLSNPLGTQKSHFKWLAIKYQATQHSQQFSSHMLSVLPAVSENLLYNAINPKCSSTNTPISSSSHV